MITPISNTRQIIGDNIRCNRHKRTWSQGRPGLETGINPDYLSRVERGLGNVDATTIAKIAQALTIELSSLFIRNYCFEH